MMPCTSRQVAINPETPPPSTTNMSLHLCSSLHCHSLCMPSKPPPARLHHTRCRRRWSSLSDPPSRILRHHVLPSTPPFPRLRQRWRSTPLASHGCLRTPHQMVPLPSHPCTHSLMAKTLLALVLSEWGHFLHHPNYDLHLPISLTSKNTLAF